jgi:hypothetical protein
LKKPAVVVLILLPLILGAGAVGAALAGLINVPGLTPKKQTAPGLTGGKPQEAQPAPSAKAPARRLQPTVKIETVAKDAERGDKKLASLWNNLPADRLVRLASDYSDEDLARVVLAMDPEKAAELLAGLEPKRAALLSKKIQETASVVPARDE